MGFLYLAVVIDVWSRRVVGWAMGERMTADLVLAALNMALEQRKPIPCNAVAAFHHDHLFIPVNRANDAFLLLEALSQSSAPAVI